jgi:hypothetical protein
MRRAVIVITLALCAAGCLRKDMTTTWYLDADLTVVWSVLERDVRSDSDSLEERQRDEGQYASEARQQNQPVARGLKQLGPSSVRVRMLRDKVPFTVSTDATFASLKVLGERLLGRLGLEGYSAVTATKDGWEWTWSIDAHAVLNEDNMDEDFSALFESEVIKIALNEGQFVENDRVELSQDRRMASFPIRALLDGLEKRTGDTPTVFTLRWNDRVTAAGETAR